MEKYRLYITSESGERETWTSGETVKECIDKLKDFHTFGEFEKAFFTKKGEDRLNKELNSGWYINLKNKIDMVKVTLQNFGDEKLEIYGGDIRNVIYSKDQAKDMLEQLSHVCEGLDDFIKSK